MALHDRSRHLSDRVTDPRFFLLQSWVVTIAILVVLVILLIATLSMLV